jgi:DNA-binding XRE family transcriptional regulator
LNELNSRAIVDLEGAVKNEPKNSRTQASQTQREAAAVLGVHCRTWQVWERGINPIPDLLLKLYRHLVGLECIPFHPAECSQPDGLLETAPTVPSEQSRPAMLSAVARRA